MRRRNATDRLQFTLSVERRTHEGGEAAVVHLTGELDVASASTLRTAVTALLDEDVSPVVVDLSALELTDSSGLAVLVAASKRARAVSADLALVCPPGGVRQVLDLTGLVRVFRVVGTVEQAFASTAGRPATSP